MFFWNRRRKDDEVEDQRERVRAKRDELKSAEATSLEGTAPELVEVSETNFADKSEEEALPVGRSEDVRLFPGFEQDDFEVGFRAADGNPCLVMRWKDGGEWFPMPPLFNRSILAAIDERESAADLNRLLRNYGYDVDAVAK